MSQTIIIHAPDSAKPATERLVSENLENKLDSYLRPFADREVRIDVKIELHADDGSYSGTLNVDIVDQHFHFDRERYVHLADLINHLFDKLKEKLARK
ncbi:MAG: hypothetical protein U0518_00130 [Candidatus Gracilibacteria bacterium]